MIAIYARQSIEKKDSISIETQIEMAKREIHDEPFEVYQDSGFSGKDVKRPAFAKMMKQVSEGTIEKVIVYKLDRVSRSLSDFSNFMDILNAHNVSFVSHTEKFDTSTPVGKAMLYVVVVFAQLERETIAERVKDNYYARVKNGAWGGGPAPYGYDLQKTIVNGKKATILVPNDDLENVQLMFDTYMKDGASLASVQRVLSEKGILSAKGVPFASPKLSSILKSPSYVKANISIYNFYRTKGVIMANDVDEYNGSKSCIMVGNRCANERKYNDVTDHLLALASHEGVIDPDDFLFVQHKLSQNKQIKNTYKGKYSWLTGLVKCGHCGYSFSVRHGSTKEGKTPYFSCSGKYVYKCCDTNETYRVRDVEKTVEDMLTQKSMEYELESKIKPPVVNKDIQKKIVEIDAKIQNLIYNLEESSSVSMKYISSRIDALHVEKAELLEQYNATLAQNKERREFPFSPKEWPTLGMAERSVIARTIIAKVILDEKSVHILYK